MQRALRRVRFLTTLAVLVPFMGHAQFRPDSVLAGLTSVDARVILGWDERIASQGGFTESQARSIMEAKFTLELRKLGLIVSSDAVPFTFCTVTAITVTGVVAYRWAVKLNEIVWAERLKRNIWGTTWETGGVATVGIDNLSESIEKRAVECAEKFGNAWLAANSKPQD